MLKAKVNKSEVIRKLHNEGNTVKQIKAKTKYSDGLIRLVIRNYRKKTRKANIFEPLEYFKKAMDVVEKKSDLVNKPPHYTVGGIDFLDYAEAKGLTDNAYLFNVVKYVTRAGKKLGVDPVQDLEKAEFYLKREIERRKSA